jgi:hypothetical protein
MTLLWGVLAVLFVVTPVAVGVLLWSQPLPTHKPGKLLTFTAAGHRTDLTVAGR